VAGVPLEFEHTSGGGSCAPRIPSAFHAHEDGSCDCQVVRPVTAPRDEIEALADELRAARRHITELEAELQAMRAQLADATGSASARIAVAVVRKARRVVPPESRRQQTLHKAASRTLTLVDHGPSALAGLIRRDRDLRRAIGVADTAAARRRQYRRWLALHTPGEAELEAMRRASAAETGATVISLVMPVHNPERSWLEAAIRSALEQTYPHLELCIADDASTLPHVRRVLDTFAADPRVRVVYRDQQGGIAAASNSALALATGAFVGFIDNDDVLRPHALFAMAAYLREHPDADVVYSDEDKLLADGTLGAPTFKPDFSPDRLLAENYINHFTVARRSRVNALGGFREGFDGSQDHDLMLRVTENAAHVGHVPDVLYAWRMVPGSTAVSAGFKPLAQDAGRRAVAEALGRRGIEGRVDLGPSPGLYIPRYAIAGSPLVDVVVVARTHGADATDCIAELERVSTYTDRWITRVIAGNNTPAAINAAVRALRGDHVVLLDASTRVITPTWLETMLEVSQHAGIGAVGMRLRYPDGTVAHEGMVCGRLGLAASVDQHLHVIKEMRAVSGACLMTRRDVFDAAGGVDEAFTHALWDVDYCLRVQALGHRVLCTPLAEMTWGEAARIGGAGLGGKDARTFADRWGGVDEIDDPYLNVNVLWPAPLSLRLD
jgi:GT2 family glycosyltransferase